MFLSYLTSLTLLSILIGPKFDIGNRGHVRLEDILLIILSFLIITHLLYYRDLKIKKILIIPLAYFFYSFAITLVRYVGGSIDINAFVFWGKEFQYWVLFLGAYFTYRYRPRLLWKTGILAAIVIIVHGFLGYFTSNFGPYGQGVVAIGEGDSPSLSGLTFSLLCIFLFSLSRLRDVKYKRSFLRFILISLFFLTLMTASRVSIILISSFFIFIWAFRVGLPKAKIWLEHKPRILPRILFIVLILSFLFSMAFLFSSNIFRNIAIHFADPLFNRVFRRLSYISSDMLSERLVNLSKLNSPLSALFGLGRGALNMENGRLRSFTLSADSSYIRNIVEIGIFGSLIWFFVFWKYVLIFIKDKKTLVLYSSILFSYLFISISGEPFLLSKSASMFWIILGILLAHREYSCLQQTKRIL